MSLRKLLLLMSMVWVLATGACGLGPNPARATLQATASPQPAATATDPPSPTATKAPTNIAAPSATATATEDPAGTATPITDTPSPTAGTAAAGENKGEFVADVTVPDGTNFTPGEEFVKTWRIKNVGTNTWGAGYLFVFAKGEQMGGPQAQALPSRVAPGETVDVSLDLTAPGRLGSYTGFWQLRTDTGVPFGIGPEANQPVYVQINVTVAANASPGPIVAAGTLQVTGVTLSVDQANITGACPQTFVFSAALTSQGAGTMTYRLEASADTPGFTFNLPETAQSSFTGAGPRTFNASYTLEFSGSVSGQMWVHVLAPNDIESNKVIFSLTCQAAGE